RADTQRCRASPQVGHAMSFVDEKADDDIGVQDIARAVRLSPRALQYLFRRYLDTTPSDYLRRVRLDHAHRDLVAGDRTTTAVKTSPRAGGSRTPADLRCCIAKLRPESSFDATRVSCRQLEPAPSTV